MHKMMPQKQHTRENGYLSQDAFSRGVSVLLGVILCVSILCSALFLSLETHHDCAGEDCPICAVVMQCERLLQSGGIVCFAIAASFLAFSREDRFLPKDSFYSAKTLFSERVRLNP